MKKSIWAAALLSAGLMMSCGDDVSSLGGSLTTGEVSISVDSIVADVEARSIYYDSFDGRNLIKLLGRINVPEYGSLDCSFVSQMLSAQKMNIPDSISVNDVDSIRMVLSVPRGSLTGDSLAPQQLTVYRLNRQLPAGISSDFDPKGYYDPSVPMGRRSYTLSNIAKGDSALKRDAYVRIPVMLPIEFGRELFNKYRQDNSIFAWPETFNQYFPGIYVEQNFGNGCVANVAKAEIFTYWHRMRQVSQMQPDSTYKPVDVLTRDSVCLLASQPEVLSSNIMRYRVSEYLKGLVAAGRTVVTTPGGYVGAIELPVKQLLDAYNENASALQVVSDLRFELPASEIANDYGLTVAPNMLLIKKSEAKEFFEKNKVPDNLHSFQSGYDSEKRRYVFGSMRKYFLEVLEAQQKGEEIGPEYSEFLLVPVSVSTETVDGYNSSTTYVTRCQPYLTRPTMTEIHADKSIITFTYSAQQIQ